MRYRLKKKLIAIFMSLILFTVAFVFLLGYYSIPPDVLPDSRVFLLEEEGVDIVFLHLRQRGYFKNYILKVIVEGISYQIYNSTHMVSDRGDYVKYLATGRISAASELLYGKVFTIYSREEPLDGHIVFWGKILSGREPNLESIIIGLERAVLTFPGSLITFRVNIERVPNVRSSEHPRIFFSDKADVSALKNLAYSDVHNYMNISFPKVFSSIKETADFYLTETYFSVYGGAMYVYLPPNQPRRHADNFPYWTGISRQIQYRLETLAFLYLVTGEKAYAERAKTFMLYMAGWSQWTDPDYRCAGPRTCLDIGHICVGMAIAYDWVHDVLDAAEKYIIRSAIISKGIIPIYTEATEPNSWLQDPLKWPNGYAIVISGLGIASLAILSEDPRAEIWLETAIKYTLKWMDAMGSDGGYTEGHTYASYATDYISRFLFALLKCRGINLFNHPFMRNFPYFVIYSMAPDGISIINFEDADYSTIYEWKIPMAISASVSGNRYAQWFLYAINYRENPAGVYTFVGFDPNIEPLRPDGCLPTSKVFRSIGWAIFRTGWRNNDTLFAFKCGPWGSHHHLDAADFVLNYQGVWFAAAPGYRLASSTEAHNTLLIDGKGQRQGDGHLIGFFNSSFIDYVGGDASKTYLVEGLSFTREVIFIRPNVFIILDDVRASKSVSVSWIMHSEVGSSIEVSGSQGTIRRKGKVLNVKAFSAQRISSRLGSHEDLPYLRFDVEPSDNIRLLTFLNPASRSYEEVYVSFFIHENDIYAEFSFADGEKGLIVFPDRATYHFSHLKGMRSDSRIFGAIWGSNEEKYFILGGSLLLNGSNIILKFDCRGYGAVKVCPSKILCEIYVENRSNVSIYSPNKPAAVYRGPSKIPFHYDDRQKVVVITLDSGYNSFLIEL
ncbi:MAG: DUF4962 domain-containing protein [Candidatus Bathyarchaeia archaeon]